MRFVTFACFLVLASLASVGIAGQSASARTTAARPADRASAPRIAPLPEREWTSLQRDIASAYAQGARPTNDLRIFLAHPDLVGGVMPFANYIAQESTLTRRERGLLILRAAWLSRSPYIWAKFAARAQTWGLTPDDFTRIAAGPEAPGLMPFDAALLRAADQLHHASFVAEDTWTALASRYSTEQLMDAVFTVAEFTMLSMTVNAAHTPIDDEFTARMPASGSDRANAPRTHTALATPRIPPLEPTFWTGEIRAMLDPDNTGRDVAAVYRTFARHPALYVPRQILSEHIRLKNTLPPRIREMVILRIGYLCGSEYEWAAHARAGRSAGLADDEVRRIAAGPGAGWNAKDAAVLRAVDELYADDDVTDATWKELAAQFDRKQLLDFLITAGGYRMVSMALNSFGVPLEAGSERFPERPVSR